ncbi:MAG: hypothetical protein OHK0022_26570 [Roseiflexaceae bacterium]
MTQRERIREEHVETTSYQTNTRPVAVGAAAAADENMALVNPTDRVRWGPIIAGMFAALATLATLSVLGLAIGLSALDTSNVGNGFGLGAGIWGAISTLIAFAVGGWIAARTAAVAGSGSGILHGAMVWFVAIPLLLYALGSGIGAITRAVGGAASTAIVAGSQAAGAAAGQAADNPALQATAQAGAQDLGQAAQATAQALGNQITPEQTQQVANSARDAAWTTLLSLGLAAAAAIGGGYLGARPLRRTLQV